MTRDLYTTLTIGYDSSFEMNKFNQPKIISEIETIRNVVLFILFAVPGQYPSLPTIGLDIQTMLYSHYDDIDENDLKEKIISQCAALGQYFTNGTIVVRKTKYRNQPSLLIHIEGTESLPTTYMKDNAPTKYMIGITFDDLKQMIYSINAA